MMAERTVIAATIAPETMATLPRGPLEMVSESRVDVVWGGVVEEDGREAASGDTGADVEEEGKEEKEEDEG
ncbi:hypothetical protein EST38_g8166 [Candolleomyces aberdarensis]|uniref:Uncharacterized protein n=1 Tax=Candolleomyces aberdarensis TaxID=2316362 RepID=A0A4Q2DD83_9AGAR|nr:hypothetical protein EST38_g8166 [Candolleomyces aberdarensis]